MRFDVFSRADLFREGHTRRSIQSAVRRGLLIHARRDRYLPADAPEALVRAVRVGGRLTCLSLLALLGVFVLENRRLHVHLAYTSSRLSSPHHRGSPLGGAARRGLRLHWMSLVDECAGGAVGLVDALIHAVLCQPPRAAVATLDSALNRGLIDIAQLAMVFAGLPARYSALAPLVDGRAESGPETLVRLMARALGCHVELQVTFEGIGRVDLVLDGWLVVECDSKQFHASWAAQARDRERDAALAALGYSTLRLSAAMVMYRPESVLAALRGLIGAQRMS
ncbi:endonuclease domain-containing protein [Microbacterium sp. SSM24]|uniref:endonuclease domain-containing protein n=1 Tax=Microbacterium sp. SSM24 TaxID=2991714 RepID=UPI002225F166|nr:DUF559 domain-containing protein [Microbacterium sp. SSM24]MCW3493693.1 DUF559 domain-containing protein [Microbacterium sp. SSM24]